MSELKLEDLKVLDKYLTFKDVSRIEKGWSKDEKYLITTKDGFKLLLRVSDIEVIEKKKQEYKVIDLISKQGINSPKTLDFKINNDKVYQLFTYIEGVDGQEVIDKYSSDNQYQLGVIGGKILKAIHNINVNNVTVENEKVKRRIVERVEKYKQSKFYSVEDDFAINYVLENINLIDNGKIVLTHGDFHLGNLVIDEMNLGVIDFNRFSYEDHYRDFTPLFTFSREKSIEFAKGQLDGYFNHEVPDYFFKHIKVYLAYASVYSVLWAEPYSLEEVDTMLKIKKMIYTDFDYFKLDKPKWFK